MELTLRIEDLPYPTEFFLHSVEILSVKFQDNKLKGMDFKENSSIACRVFKDGKFGFATASSQISHEKLFQMALEGADYGKKAYFSLVDGPDKPETWNAYSPEINSLSQDDLIGMGQAVTHRLSKAKPDYINTVGLGRGRETVQIITNQGINRCFSGDGFSMGYGLEKTAEGDLISFHRGFNHIPTETEMDESYDKTYRSLDLCENVVSMDGGNYPVLFHPVSFTYMWEPLYAGLAARAVYEKISPLVNKMGDQILSDKLTILDDPTWKEGDNHGYFDDEGVPLKQRTLVDKGVLKSYLNNLDYAGRLDIEPTGNGYRKNWLTNNREVTAPPSILPSNRVVMPGDDSWEDMVGSISDGILLWFTADCWLGNLINGDFSGTIDLGYKVKDGKLVGRIKNMRLSGNVYSLFKDQLKGISSSRDFSYNGHDLFPYILCEDVAIA